MAVKLPAKHDDTPDDEYPALQRGWHLAPEANVAVQSPLAPFAGAADASHGFGLQVAAVSLPNAHDDVPDTV